MRVCGDWLSAEPGKPGKPAADGGNRMWQRRVVTRRKTKAKTMDGKKRKKKRGIPGGMYFSYISSLSAPKIYLRTKNREEEKY